MTTGGAQETVEGPRWIGLTERRQVDISEAKPTYLLSGRNGSNMRLSASAHRLLQLRQSGVSSEEIAAALSRSQGSTISGEELEAKYQKLLERIESIEDNANDNPLGFWFRIRLLPEVAVVRIVSVLTPLFKPQVVAALLLSVAMGFAIWGAEPLTKQFHDSSFWAGYALLMLSIVFHELGHATACAYYGARPSDIGFTFYLIYPALYSDVSSAWRLQRKQRVVVDLGGLYFQWLTAAVYLVAYSLTGWEPLGVGILMIAGSSLFSLNPIFKFDGYWMLADALGVTNLSRQPSRIIKHYWHRLRGRPAEELPWSERVTATLAVYSVLSIAVWGFFIWKIAPRVWSSVRLFPDKVMAFAAGSPEVSLSSLLMSGFMALFMVYIGWRMFRSIVLRPLVSVGRLVSTWVAARRAVGADKKELESTP